MASHSASSSPALGEPAGPALGWRVFDDHAGTVVLEATARLVPGPLDDSAEAGHPGAREAGVARYIDELLAGLEAHPGRRFFPSGSAEHLGATARRADWVTRYAAGTAALDELAGGDFVAVQPEQRDAALAVDPGGFTTLLFAHTIEAMYSLGQQHSASRVSPMGQGRLHGYPSERVAAPGHVDNYAPDTLATALLELIAAANNQ
ncbi:MAG: gluconate 2-dehydrogenase subunit 3 family protein [Acidimicrobiales bacterium]